MSGWPEVTLSEVFDIARGGSPRPIDDFVTDSPDGINWVTIGDASEGSKYITRTKRRIRREGVSRSRQVKPGDFLLTNSMSFGRPYIMSISGCIHDGWLMLSPRRGDVDADFFYHLLGSGRLYTEFERMAAGATVKNLNIDIVRNVKVVLPPLPEQRRIAAILDKADELRTKRRAALEQLNGLTQAMFLEMFGDPTTNPKGLPRVPLRMLGTVVTGGTPSRDIPGYYGNEIEWIKSDNINTAGAFLTPAVEKLSVEGRAVARTAPSGSILVTCIAGTPACIGNVAIADREVAFNQQINAVIPASDVDPYFLYGQFVAGKKLVQRASTGGMKGLVSKSRFEGVQFIVPPQQEQVAFGRQFLAVQALLSGANASLNRLSELFATIQHQAFSGAL